MVLLETEAVIGDIQDMLSLLPCFALYHLGATLEKQPPPQEGPGLCTSKTMNQNEFQSVILVCLGYFAVAVQI